MLLQRHAGLSLWRSRLGEALASQSESLQKDAESILCRNKAGPRAAGSLPGRLWLPCAGFPGGLLRQSGSSTASLLLSGTTSWIHPRTGNTGGGRAHLSSATLLLSGTTSWKHPRSGDHGGGHPGDAVGNGNSAEEDVVVPTLPVAGHQGNTLDSSEEDVVVPTKPVAGH